MKAKTHRLVVAGILLHSMVLGWACATPQTKRVAGKSSVAKSQSVQDPLAGKLTRPGDCDDFSQVIHSCAKKGGHEKLGDLLYGVASCETGKKCIGNIDSPTGRFHGPFQFINGTWNSQCHAIFAQKGITACNSKASIHDTCCATICASEMISQGGIGNWPVCGKRAKKVGKREGKKVGTTS